MSKKKSDEVVCYGLRFSHVLVRMKNERGKKWIKMLQKVEDDLREYGEGNVFTMEAEDKDLPYLYFLFTKEDDQKEFFDKHKEEKAYKDGKLTLIVEKAFIPKEYLDSSSSASSNEEAKGEEA